MERQAKDYTIGWISSTDFELAAAVAMFDEEHASLRVPPQDSNRYKLGRVQGHNIIMASLPRGFYGPTSAAITARDMLRSFPAIRFCLLVGVGAGVPSADRDIRLGDVVVSYPNNSSGGVIQFDLGTVTSQGVAPSEAGNVKQPPPDILLSAVNSLQAKFRMEKSRRRRFIKEAHEKYPNMGDCFSFPGRSQDLLFQATYHHPLGNVDCSSCDKSCLVIRSDRDDEIPVIHYGTIASSQSVIKDATFRDKFGKDLGAICFEMEAAGVMSALPSIVIKGIVDYADSHRGKDWHSYAALAAAAYSKELLSVLPADTSDRMSAAADLLDPDLFDDHLVSQDLDFPDTVSQTSTLIESLDEGIVTTAIMEVAHVLATKGRLRALCTAAVMRVGPFRLQSILLLALTGFSKALKKNAQTPVGRGMRWLFSRYRPLIATYVTEDICKQDHVSGSLGLSRDEAPSIPADRLLETINERFSETKTPAIAPHKDSLNSIQNTVMSGVTTQVVDEDIDLDILDLPGSSLADLRQLNQALCEGEWFEDMLENLEALLLPPIAKVIARILERHIFSTTETSVVNCSVEWELLSYARSDDLSVDEIDTIFILVGDFDHAYAISLGRYMSETWKTGKEVLEVVKAAIANAFNDVFDILQTNSGVEASSVNRTQIQLFPASIPGRRESAIVRIAGDVSYIQHTLEQLALLAAVMRPPHEGQLTVSYVDFQPQEARVGGSTSRDFKLCLWDQEKLPVPEGRKGQCWTQLFFASTLAYGFPLADEKRPEGMLGLELPFEIMLAFSGMRYPVLLGERFAFASQTHILIPEMTAGDSIQWHFDTIDNVLQELTTAKEVANLRPDHIDAADFRESRAFLGYDRLSEVLIGTADFEGVDITACDVPSTGTKLHLMNQGSLGLGFSLKGFATTSVSGNWKFNRGELGQIKSSDLSLDELFKAAAESPALMYDDRECIAFLVPELSIALQMTATYLQKESELTFSKIPRAKRSPDGGAAAYRAVTAAKNLMIPFQTEAPRKYVDVLRSFLELFDQRRLQKRANREFYEVSLKKGLRGWDYTNIQEKKFEFHERELLKPRPNWWKLFGKSNTIVLFGRGMMRPISGCINHNPPSCISWNTIPEGKHLLLANIRDLQRLRSKTCQSSKHPRCFMLTEKLAWARPVNSRLFQESCTQGGRCNPLQAVCKASSLTRMRFSLAIGPAYLPHPGPLELDGSVLFAEDPSEFEDRLCSIASEDQNIGQLNWNTLLGWICLPLFTMILWVVLNLRSIVIFVFLKGFNSVKLLD